MPAYMPQTWALPAAFPLHVRQLHRTESCLCIQQQLQLSARPPPACQMICCCTNCSQTVAAHHAPNECSTALLQQCCRLGSSPRISCAPDAATCPFLSNTLLQRTSHDNAFDTLLPTTSHHTASHLAVHVLIQLIHILVLCHRLLSADAACCVGRHTHHNQHARACKAPES